MVSIIIPVYNIEKKIRRCIDSVLLQTYQDFEIIIIDDGSTDCSAQICEEYSFQDNRITVIHQENKGVSAARNSGINAAKGEYLCFIDGDDFIAPNYLEVLMLKDEDLSIGSVYYAKSDGIISDVCRSEQNTMAIVNNNNILRWYEHESLYSVWTSMFRKKIILENNIYFDPHFSRGEDTVFMLQYVEQCKVVRFSASFVYYYVQYGENGSSSKKMNLKNICALNQLDHFLGEWFIKHGVISQKYENKNYWTKAEQLGYFQNVWRNNDMTFLEKRNYYKALFQCNNFTDYTDVNFINKGRRFKFFIKTKNATIFTIYDFFIHYRWLRRIFKLRKS